MRVVAIARVPVKSTLGESLQEAVIGTGGIEGDRAYGVVDPATGKVLSAKTERRLLEASSRIEGGVAQVCLPDGDWLGCDDPKTSEAVAAWLDRDVRVQRASTDAPSGYTMPFPGTVDGVEIDVPCPPASFFDLAPVHVLTTASLRTIWASQLTSDFSPNRFRPTILVHADHDGFIENDWVGSNVRVGDAVLSVFMPTIRCAMTTRPQAGVGTDVEVLKSINRENSSNLGAYATVATPGRVALGDSVEVG